MSTPEAGTGISTGLNIAFTLGCGTCGGSSVSENVSPMQLINIKKVAYGLKDCTTLMEDDKTFHPGMAVTDQPAGSIPAQAASACGPCRGNLSPAAIVAAYDARNTDRAADTTEAAKAIPGENEKLAALVRQLITTMKDQKDA